MYAIFGAGEEYGARRWGFLYEAMRCLFQPGYWALSSGPAEGAGRRHGTGRGRGKEGIGDEDRHCGPALCLFVWDQNMMADCGVRIALCACNVAQTRYKGA